MVGRFLAAMTLAALIATAGAVSHAAAQPWGFWGDHHRPACPLNYYFACRRGPLGYRQCACWPYWTQQRR